jgi:nicotinamidase-related amidase
MAEEYPIIPEKTAMLFFDCYYGSNPENLEKLRAEGYVDKLVQIEQACRKAGIAIFYTQPEHRQDGKDWPVTVVGDPDAPTLTTYGGVLYKGSHAATILPDIEPQPHDYLITKHRWSSFFETCLDQSLRTAGIDTIMQAGGATQIGIASTAYSARDRGYNQIILSDAIHSTPEIDAFFCTHVFPRLARVMTVEKAISMFAVPAAV